MTRLRGIRVDVDFGESMLTIYPSLRGGPLAKVRSGERVIPYSSVVSVSFKDTPTLDSVQTLRGLAKAATSLGPGWIELTMKDGSHEKITFGGTFRKNYQGFVDAYAILLTKIGTRDSRAAS